MKKVLTILSIVLVIGLTLTMAYGSRFNMGNWRNWYGEKMQWNRQDVEKELEASSIGEEEAKTWEEHFDYMEKFHKENGFMPGCHDGVTDSRYERMGPGHRRGMMRGHRWK